MWTEIAVLAGLLAGFAFGFWKWRKIPRDFRRVLAAAFVLTVLVAVHWGQQKYKDHKGEETQKAEKLVSLDLEGVQKIAVQSTKQGRVVLQRRKAKAEKSYEDEFSPYSDELYSVSEWLVVEPYRWLPEASLTSNLIRDLKDLKRTKIISEKGENPEAYELQTPRITLELFAKPEEKPVLSLWVGSENTADTGVYMRTSASPAIVLAEKSLETLETRKPEDWRIKKMFSFKSMKDVSSLAVSYGGKEKFALEREKESWKLEKPTKLPADTKAVEEVLDGLSSLQPKEYLAVDPLQNQSRYGFSSPWAVFELSLTTGETQKERKIVMGKTKKDLWYVYRTDLPAVFAVEKSSQKKLRKDEIALWVRKELFPISSEKVETLEIEKAGQETVRFSRKDSQWTRQPHVEGFTPDSIAINRLLASLTNLRGEKFLGQKSMKTVRSSWTLRLFSQEKRLAVDFHLRGKNVWAQTQEPNLGYEMPKEKFEDVEKQLESALQAVPNKDATKTHAGSDPGKDPMETETLDQEEE